MMNRTIVIALCGVLLTGNIRCQKQEGVNLATPAKDSSDLSAKLAAIEKAVEAMRQTENVPGVALVIVKDDSVILQKGFGLRNVEAGLPVTPQTLFNIGSCTKTFTALAAVISADEGKLSLDDSPKKFLPYFKLRDPEADARVTLRDLLSHRTGVKMYDDAGWFERHPTREGLIRFAMESEPTARFRELFQYNNFMYLAAGEVIAAAHNATFEDVITSLIFKPLGMHTSNLSISAMQQAADFSYGYSDDKERKLVPMQNLASLHGIAPAGAINSNAKEMAQWLRLMLGGGVIDGKRLVSEKGFQEMLVNLVKTQGGHYGLGLFIEEWHGHQLYYHHGGVPGFGSRFEFMPDQRLGLVILTNVDDQKLPKEIIQIVHSNLMAQP